MSAQMLSLFLRAVAIVESGNNPAAVGRSGELGLFQMAPAVVATCGGYGEHQAAKWERQIERELIAAGIEPIPFNVALVWNAGITAVRRGKATVPSYDYACRVVNLMEKLKSEGVQ